MRILMLTAYDDQLAAMLDTATSLTVFAMGAVGLHWSARS
jgi:hypothetical protein